MNKYEELREIIRQDAKGTGMLYNPAGGARCIVGELLSRAGVKDEALELRGVPTDAMEEVLMERWAPIHNLMRIHALVNCNDSYDVLHERRDALLALVDAWENEDTIL